MDSVEAALRYHERTKHRPGHFAPSLGYLDWDTQPDPFRRFEGAELVSLDLVAPEAEPSLEQALSGTAPAALAADRRFVSQLFHDALALSAWKEQGSARWPLRVNPSSGNLHPTEGYLISGPIPGLLAAPAICHYAPSLHALERRTELSAKEWALLVAGLPAESLLLGLCSITWREAWKYGERAFRYCHHDAGHAIGTVAIAASGLGWRAHLLEAVTDSELGSLLGTRHQGGPEAERPDCLLLICRRQSSHDPRWRPPSELLDRLGAERFAGQPNTLSPDHHEWPVIAEVGRAIEKHEPPPPAFWTKHTPEPGVPPVPAVGARPVIQGRRSAVAFDGKTGLSRAAFYHLLASALPGERVPFTALPWQPRVHLALFVHRVADLEPGLYFLPRAEGVLEAARAAFRPEFLWESAPECPPGLDLRLLVPADVRDLAQMISCQQDIAADGAFALGMIAELEGSLRELGGFMYERLHWEAGAVGQVLYLEAEAAGLRGTGIGCFFDDVLHDLLGVADRRFQTLYHFTIGGAVDDPRLRTAPPYAAASGPAPEGSPRATAVARRPLRV